MGKIEPLKLTPYDEDVDGTTQDDYAKSKRSCRA